MDQFPTEEGEEILLQASVQYVYTVKIARKKKKGKTKMQSGTLAVTNKRVAFCKTTGCSGISLSFPFEEIHHWQVSKASVTKVMLKIETVKDKELKDKLLAAKKKLRPNQIGTTFIFTSPSALSERDAMRDLIVQLHMQYKQKSGELPMQLDVPRTVLDSEGKVVKLMPVKKEEGKNTDRKESLETTPKGGTSFQRSSKRRRLDLSKLAQGNKKIQTKHNGVLGSTSGCKTTTKYNNNNNNNNNNLISIAEAKQRAALLAGDQRLKELYNSLVGYGVLNEREFWEARAYMIDAEAKRSSNQMKGLPTRNIADVKPSIETCNAVHYKINASIIRQIFLEHPSVQRAYDENVPDKISELKFWEKYFQSQYFHRDRHFSAKKTKANTKEDMFALCAQEDDELLEREAEAAHNRLESLVQDPSDILTLHYNEESGRGVSSESSFSSSLSSNKTHAHGGGMSKHLSLIRRTNRHGSLVLQPEETLELTAAAASGGLSMGTSRRLKTHQKQKKQTKSEKKNEQIKGKEGGKEEEEEEDINSRGLTSNNTEEKRKYKKQRTDKRVYRDRINAKTYLEELEDRPRLDLIPLTIENQKRYFEGHGSSSNDTEGTSSENDVKILDLFKKKVVNWDPTEDLCRSSKAVIDGELSYQILSDITKRSRLNSCTTSILNSRVGSHDDGDYNGDGDDEDLNEELLAVFQTANELMRHFWAAYPITSSAHAAKANRIIAAISTLYDQITEMKDSLPRHKRNKFGQLLRPILQSLDKVIEKHQSQSAF